MSSILAAYHKLANEIYERIVVKNLKQQDEFSKEQEEEFQVWLEENGYSENKRFLPQSHNLFPASLPVYASYVVKKYCDQFGLDFKEMFKLNSDNLRSDEFKKEHEGKHILFAGCSITFGDGLPVKYTWPHIVYSTIAQQEKLSGFYNVGRPGASNIWILMQIMKYIELYGIPETIFINFPDPEREIADSEETKRIHIIPVILYRFINHVVTSNGGRIISVSWDARANIDYDGDLELPTHDARGWFDNFYQYSMKNRFEHTFNFYEKHRHSEDVILRNFSVTAMDDSHPGAGEHDFFATIALDAYYERIQPSNPFVPNASAYRLSGSGYV